MAKKQAIFGRKYATVVNYKAFFSDPIGKKVLLDLVFNHYLRISFDPQNPDLAITAFREGERNVVTRILSIVNMGDEQMEKLIEEANLYGRASNQRNRK